MTADVPESHSLDQGARVTQRHEVLILSATWVGLLFAAVGVIDGVVMALKRTEASCPDGTYFPEGTTDFSCYAHPQAGLGIAIVAISVLLGVLVVLGSISARASLRPRPSST